MVQLLLELIQDLAVYLPLQRPLLGLLPWQWLGLFAILCLGSVSTLLFLLLLRRLLLRSHLDLPGIQKINFRGSLLGMILFFLYHIPLLQLNSQNALLSNAIYLINIIAVLLILLLVHNILDLIFFLLIAHVGKKHRHSLGILQISKGVVKVIVLSITFLFVPRLLVSYDTSYLLGKLTIGLSTVTAIIAFASKDLIANFFGALVIILGRPFKIGDAIAIDKFEGRVVRINMRATELITQKGTSIYVPNGIFTNKHVINYGPVDYIPLPLDLPLHQLTATQLQDLLAAIEKCFQEKPYIIEKRSHIALKEISTSQTKMLLHLSFKRTTENKKLLQLQDFMQTLHKITNTFLPS